MAAPRLDQSPETASLYSNVSSASLGCVLQGMWATTSADRWLCGRSSSSHAAAADRVDVGRPSLTVSGTWPPRMECCALNPPLMDDVSEGDDKSASWRGEPPPMAGAGAGEQCGRSCGDSAAERIACWLRLACWRLSDSWVRELRLSCWRSCSDWRESLLSRCGDLREGLLSCGRRCGDSRGILLLPP